MTFRHPLVRAAVLRTVDDPTLRDVHRTIAELLPPGERRALHRAEATVGTDDKAAAELIAAADDVPAVTGAALLTRAADLLAEASERARVLGEAARLASLAGRLDQATSLVERGLALEPPDRVRGGLLVTSGRIAWMTRPPDEAMCTAPRRRGAARGPGSTGGVVRACGCVQREPRERLRRELDRGADPRACRPVRADGAGAGRPRLGDLARAARPPRRRASRHSVHCSPSPRRAGPASRLQDAGVIAALWLYDYPRALEEVARAIESARSAGHLSRLPQLLQFQGFAEARSGRFAAAYAAVSEAVSLAEELGQVVIWSDAVNTLAGLEARLGLHDRCHEHAALAIDRCTALGLDWFRGHAMSTSRSARSRCGRGEHAVELVEEVHALLRRAGVKDPDEFAYETLVEALVQLGRHDAAAAAVVEMEALFAAVGRSAHDSLAVRCTRSSRETSVPLRSSNGRSRSTPTTHRSSSRAHASSTGSGFAGWESGVVPAISSRLSARALRAARRRLVGRSVPSGARRQRSPPAASRSSDARRADAAGAAGRVPGGARASRIARSRRRCS